MYQGHNPTAIRSQREMAEALFMLMGERDFEKLTITGICRRAGCSRQTFYQLFSCKEDIVRFSLRNFFEEINREMDFETIDFKGSVKLFLRKVEGIEKQGKLIIKNGLSHLLFEEMLTSVQRSLEGNLKDQPKETLSYAGAFLAGAMGSTIMHWLQSDYKMSVDELSELICRMLGSSQIKKSALSKYIA